VTVTAGQAWQWLDDRFDPHPGEWWWLFPAAWLGWSAAFTTLALVIWVLAS
jgi:hypothetical protein